MIGSALYKGYEPKRHTLYISPRLNREFPLRNCFDALLLLDEILALVAFVGSQSEGIPMWLYQHRTPDAVISKQYHMQDLSHLGS